MEVKINREIREYTEAMFFGLSMRQFVFSVLACGVAVCLYYFLRPYLGMETISWACVLGAAPFAAIGFITYHGMNAEQFLWAWFKSEVLLPRKFLCEPENVYYELMKEDIEEWQGMRKKKRKPGKKKGQETGAGKEDISKNDTDLTEHL